ncbi:MAG: zinc ribbon domain-containing protein [Candidatus Bathyarchaeota archaeon]|nr:MAG: zinc ribbon domain-containing protein [Candidatus Bathyarchaeota archaeon]
MNGLAKCPKCGKNAGDFYYCVECGLLLREECPSCGNWVNIEMKTCSKCGKPNRLHQAVS